MNDGRPWSYTHGGYLPNNAAHPSGTRVQPPPPMAPPAPAPGHPVYSSGPPVTVTSNPSTPSASHQPSFRNPPWVEYAVLPPQPPAVAHPTKRATLRQDEEEGERTCKSAVDEPVSQQGQQTTERKPTEPDLTSDRTAACPQKNLTVFPSRVCYRPPYGYEEQASSINMHNVTPKLIAFKVLAASENWQFFKSIPNNGLLEPGQTTVVQLIMKRGFEPQDLMKHKGGFTFNIASVTWLDNFKSFDETVWNELKTLKKHEVQNDLIGVDVEKSGLFVKGNSEEPLVDPPQQKPAATPPTASQSPAPQAVYQPKPAFKSMMVQLPLPANIDEQAFYSKPKPEKSSKDEPTTKSSSKSEKSKDEPTTKSSAKLEDLLRATGPPPGAASLAELNPQTLAFNAPGKRHMQWATLKCVHSRPIAYKLKTTRRKFYALKPYSGVLRPGQTQSIDFEMLETLTGEELRRNPKEHTFITVVTEWTDDAPFDAAVFKRLEAANRTASITAHATHATAQEDGGKDMITTSAISFKPPYGKKKSATLRLKNDTDTTVAYKVTSNKCMYYLVTPAKGLIKPRSDVKVAIELNEKFTAEEWKKAEPGSHKFQITTARWPTTANQKRFDNDVWTAIPKDKSTQTITRAAVL